MEKSYFENLLSFISPQMQTLNEKLLDSISDEIPLMAEILQYAIFSGGKRLRPAFVFLFAQITNGEIKKQHYLLAQATELIHAASLIHDDIVDDSDIRHKKSSVHKKWDIKTGIIIGDFLLAKALKMLAEINNKQIITLFSDMLQELCRGEIQQLEQKNSFPSLEEIIEKSERKTAMLYTAAIKGSLIISNAPSKKIDAGEKFARNFGIAYQITDDFLSYNDNYEEKSNFSDFKNKIYTPVTFFAMQKNPDLMKIKDYEQFKKEIKNTAALKKTDLLVSQYINRAIDSLSFFEDNNAKRVIIELTKYINERKI